MSTPHRTVWFADSRYKPCTEENRLQGNGVASFFSSDVNDLGTLHDCKAFSVWTMAPSSVVPNMKA